MKKQKHLIKDSKKAVDALENENKDNATSLLSAEMDEAAKVKMGNLVKEARHIWEGLKKPKK
jgi:hypothetical protein